MAIKNLGMTVHEAEVYFEVFRSLSSDPKSSHPIADLKQFSLFLALQLLSNTTSRQSLGDAQSLNSKYNTDWVGH